MTKDRSILIRNIYYMLAYSFQNLERRELADVDKEDFQDVEDLFAKILALGVERQVKQGLYKEYVDKSESLTTLRGKLNMNKTIQHKLQKQQVLACEYDELSGNNVFNQVLRTTMDFLIRNDQVKVERKNELRRLLRYFEHIEALEPTMISWNSFNYQRSNRSYQMLIYICFFVLHEMLLTTDDGHYTMDMFTEKHLHALFERFVCAFYQKELGRRNVAVYRQKQIYWDAEAKDDKLPEMVADIVLEVKGKTFIIDTKYYTHSLLEHFGKQKLISANVYQIYAYVSNYKNKYPGCVVSGLLLYAQTESEGAFESSSVISGIKMMAKTIDLNQEFEGIKNDLNRIVENELFS